MGYFNSIPDENFWVDKVLKWVVDLCLVAIVAVLVLQNFCQDTMMDGKSMSTTLEKGEYFFLDKFTYKLRDPKRYDIIDFLDPNGDECIKRIVGLPGEKIQIVNGEILIDGEKLGITDGKDTIVNGGLAADGIKLGDQEYFVIGDNWNNSEDSRFSTIGNVKMDQIIGKLWLRITPFARIGLVK